MNKLSILASLFGRRSLSLIVPCAMLITGGVLYMLRR